MKDYRFWILFAGALFLRFINISSESLWLDEGLSVRLASMSLGEINSLGLQTDHNPPLYLYLLHFWMNLFGKSELAIRSLSALLNTACIPLLWLIVNRLFNSRIAYISVLIFALSPFQIYYAQEARAYSLLCFTSLTATWAFLRLRSNPNGNNYALMTISIILLLYSHIYGWFTLLYLNAWFLLGRNNPGFGIRSWILLQSVAITAYIPYALILTELVQNAQQGYWIKKPGLIHLFSTPVYFSGSIWVFLILVTAGLGNGVYYFLKMKEKLKNVKASLLLVAAWFIVPILVPFLLSQIISPFYLPRYAVAASPAWYIIIACGISFIPKTRRVQFGNIAIMVFCMITINFEHQYFTMKEPWRDAIQDLKAASEDDVIFVGSAFCIDEMFGYYWPECGTAIGLERKTMKEDIQNGLTNLQDETTAWFLSSHFEKREDEALAQFSEAFEVNSYKDYYHWDLFGREIRSIRIFKLNRNTAYLPDIGNRTQSLD